MKNVIPLTVTLLSIPPNFSQHWLFAAGVKNVFDQGGKNGEVLIGAWSYFPGVPKRSWSVAVSYHF